MISIVSRSAEIRYWARSILLAVGLDPQCVCEIDPASPGWQRRLSLSEFAVTDVVSSSELPSGCPAQVFRIIADSFLDELRQLCGGPIVTNLT